MINLKGSEIDVLRSLSRHGVRFVVVGGRAANYHKIMREAPDLDLFYSSAGDDPSLLLECLKRYGDGNLTLDSLSNVIQITSFDGPIQLHSKIDAISFDEVYSNAAVVNVDGVQVPFISTAHFLQNKRESGQKPDREKDLRDVAELEDMLGKNPAD